MLLGIDTKGQTYYQNDTSDATRNIGDQVYHGLSGIAQAAGQAGADVLRTAADTAKNVTENIPPKRTY